MTNDSNVSKHGGYGNPKPLVLHGEAGFSTPQPPLPPPPKTTTSSPHYSFKRKKRQQQQQQQQQQPLNIRPILITASLPQNSSSSASMRAAATIDSSQSINIGTNKKFSGDQAAAASSEVDFDQVVLSSFINGDINIAEYLAEEDSKNCKLEDHGDAEKSPAEIKYNYFSCSSPAPLPSSLSRQSCSSSPSTHLSPPLDKQLDIEEQVSLAFFEGVSISSPPKQQQQQQQQELCSSHLSANVMAEAKNPKPSIRSNSIIYSPAPAPDRTSGRHHSVPFLSEAKKPIYLCGRKRNSIGGGECSPSSSSVHRVHSFSASSSPASGSYKQSPSFFFDSPYSSSSSSSSPNTAHIPLPPAFNVFSYDPIHSSLATTIQKPRTIYYEMENLDPFFFIGNSSSNHLEEARNTDCSSQISRFKFSLSAPQSQSPLSCSTSSSAPAVDTEEVAEDSPCSACYRSEYPTISQIIQEARTFLNRKNGDFER